jgi:hypothetical protein
MTKPNTKQMREMADRLTEDAATNRVCAATAQAFDGDGSSYQWSAEEQESIAAMLRDAADALDQQPPDTLTRLSAKWRAVAEQFRREAAFDRERRSMGLAQPKEDHAIRMTLCADELDAAILAAEGEHIAVRVIKLMARYDAYDQIFWSTDAEPRINCSDFFAWGTADAEAVTAENFGVLEKAMQDGGESWGGLLFCARVRGERPQGAACPKDEKIAALFDACGPSRAVDFFNPYRHPKDGGGYAYTEESPAVPPQAENALTPYTKPGTDNVLDALEKLQAEPERIK